MIVDLTMIQVPTIMMIVITDIHINKYPLGVIIRLMDIFHYVTLIAANVTLKIKNTDSKNTYGYWLLRHLSVLSVFYFN